MTTRFIVNPKSAGGATGGNLKSLMNAISAKVPNAEVILTERPNHATSLARSALAAGIETIVAVGGDGTVNEVINGFFDPNGEVIGSPTLGLIPSGTGGDYRKTWNFNRDFEANLDTFRMGRTTTADLGRIDCIGLDGNPLVRYFANVASFGMGANVCRHVNRSGKRLGGRLTFFLASARSILEYTNQNISITAGNYTHSEPMRVGAVCIGQYFGAGMHIAPYAKVNDGLFDLVTLGNLGRLEMLGMTSLYSGKHLSHAKVRHEISAKVEAVASGDTPVYIEADGEVIGRLPATFTTVANAMKVIS
jgi:YegS/Rv2252/BmrU family lipid kinase